MTKTAKRVNQSALKESRHWRNFMLSTSEALKQSPNKHHWSIEGLTYWTSHTVNKHPTDQRGSGCLNDVMVRVSFNFNSVTKGCPHCIVIIITTIIIIIIIIVIILTFGWFIFRSFRFQTFWRMCSRGVVVGWCGAPQVPTHLCPGLSSCIRSKLFSVPWSVSLFLPVTYIAALLLTPLTSEECVDNAVVRAPVLCSGSSKYDISCQTRKLMSFFRKTCFFQAYSH